MAISNDALIKRVAVTDEKYLKYKSCYAAKKKALEAALVKIASLTKTPATQVNEPTRPVHQAIADELSVVADFFGWEEFDNAEPASQKRVDIHFSAWNA